MIRPTSNRVILKKETEEEAKRGGLILPTTMNKHYVAKVVAVGPGKCTDLGVRIPPEFKEGDRVVYNQHGGQLIKIGNEEYHIFYDHDIFGVLDEV